MGCFLKRVRAHRSRLSCVRPKKQQNKKHQKHSNKIAEYVAVVRFFYWNEATLDLGGHQKAVGKLDGGL